MNEINLQLIKSFKYKIVSKIDLTNYKLIFVLKPLIMFSYLHFE